jgi:glycosidase
MRRLNPRILEINTWTWLSDLTRNHGRFVSLANIPPEAIDLDDFDAVWLMGVWERSPRSRQIAYEHSEIRKECRRVLPDFSAEDIVGSPYSIRSYRVEPRIGGEEGLAKLRARLAERGVGLLLDFVPNHVGVDHDWTEDHPTYLIQGTVEDLGAHPDCFFRKEGSIFAHGRDLYSPPWTDTVQLNALSPDARKALRRNLFDIASRCDGVRCDMAMLGTTDVFRRTWGDRGGPKPETEFWEELIGPVKKAFPGFLFIAEVYWDMEWDLQQQGFDYCYDKRLYDRMRDQDAGSIRAHLSANLDYQNRLIRFIENHDEPRASTVFKERGSVAAILALTLPGAKLVHEGQTKGYRIRTPVQLGRRPTEPVDPAVAAFYERLLNAASRVCNRYDDWRLCNVKPKGVGGNLQDLIAYTWQSEGSQIVVLANFGETHIEGTLSIEGLPFRSGWQFQDLLLTGETTLIRSTQDVRGLDVKIAPWTGQILAQVQSSCD